VTEMSDIGPIRVEMHPAEVRFRFANPRTMTLEVPISLEEELARHLEAHEAAIAGKRLVIDLEDLPAVSSRQLGIMLTIRKTCQPYGTTDLASVSDGVRYLLNLTRMAQYFSPTEATPD